MTTIDGINYGPLAKLAGNWKGDKGTDIAPEPEGSSNIPYYETIVFEPVGEVTNAQKQTLAVLRYHQIVVRKEDDEVFHNETGYYSWDATTNTVCQSLTIPRGLALLAGGTAVADATVIEVSANAGDPDWSIVQSPFMGKNARTTGFNHRLEIIGEELVYSETTVVDIYGKTYDHIDENRLVRA